MQILPIYHNLILEAESHLKAEAAKDPSKLAQAIDKNTTNDIEGNSPDSNQS